MLVARQVPHPRDPREVLVASGSLLRIEKLIQLHEVGVYDLWIDAANLHYLETLHHACANNPDQQRAVEAIIRAFETLASFGLDGHHPLLRRYKAELEELMPQLVHSAATLKCFRAVVQSDELLQHSAFVAVLGTLLGLQLENYLIDQHRRLTGKQARGVLNLALGAFFHDVGETLLPAQQRESRASLATDPDAALPWRQHTALGYQAVRNALDPPAAAVVLHHHQHFDGTGFAAAEGRELCQKGGAIHVFARITAVADMFHHLLLEPEAGIPRPPVRALAWLQQRAHRGWFDPVVLEALLSLIPPFAPGVVVTLNNRRPAVVTRATTEPCHPQVQMLRDAEDAVSASVERIDLAERPDLLIAETAGEDVTPYLYGQRCSQPLAAA
jgi:HD-GYP domain-containing protein (c-di-GMP phosphodiesterase class II)